MSTHTSEIQSLLLDQQVDNVGLPSWQAQLKGQKKWEIAPPPECYFQCKSFEVIVQPGEISKGL